MEDSVSALNQAIQYLKESGYNLSFIKKDKYIHCAEKHLIFHTHELVISEFFRYTNKFSPMENAVLYTVEDRQEGLKGMLLY